MHSLPPSETNLKVKQAISVTSEMEDNLKLLVYFWWWVFFSFEKHLTFNEFPSMWLQATRTCPTYTLNLSALSAEEFGLQMTGCFGSFPFPRTFVVTWSHHINDRSSSCLVLGSILLVSKPLTKVHNLSRLTVGQKLWFLFMVMPHTNFPKVSWVIFVKVDPVMMHATSITLAFWVLMVFADVSGRGSHGP